MDRETREKLLELQGSTLLDKAGYNWWGRPKGEHGQSVLLLLDVDYEPREEDVIDEDKRFSCRVIRDYHLLRL